MVPAVSSFEMPSDCLNKPSIISFMTEDNIIRIVHSKEPLAYARKAFSGSGCSWFRRHRATAVLLTRVGTVDDVDKVYHQLKTEYPSHPFEFSVNLKGLATEPKYVLQSEVDEKDAVIAALKKQLQEVSETPSVIVSKVDSDFVSAKEIALKLRKCDARKLNKALQDEGLQEPYRSSPCEKYPNGKQYWRLTEKGKSYPYGEDLPTGTVGFTTTRWTNEVVHLKAVSRYV